MLQANSPDNVVVFAPPRDIDSMVMSSYLGRQEALVPEHPVDAAFKHHFEAPGGRARAELTCRCATLLGIEEADGRWLAAAVECLHNASLVQDDLQDHSKDRRGQASVMAKYGSDVALGLTNRLITAAFSCVTEVSDVAALPALIGRMHQAVGETVGGQTAELAGGSEKLSFARRLEIARQKSGPLFALALELPLILAKKSSNLETAHEGGLSVWSGLPNSR